MKILFVAMSDSIHTARWINQIAGSHDIYLFPSIDTGSSHPELRDLTIFHTIYADQDNLGKRIKISGIRQPDTTISEPPLIHYIKSFQNLILTTIKNNLKVIDSNYHVKALEKVISRVKPDIIHSLEMQSGAYLVNEVRKVYKHKFPTWVISNWGSDIYYFGRDKQHKSIIRECLEHCDYYMSECARDVALAHKFGFKGKVLGVMPNGGGYDTKKYKKYLVNPASQRKSIMIKGYQGWAGRSLFALEAINKLGTYISTHGYSLILYSTGDSKIVEEHALSIANKFGLKLTILPQFTSQDLIIRSHSKARISIGLSISDGISTSLLEAMLMGSFPIQSFTACADEWILHEVTGFLVDPENVDSLVKYIKIALQNDKLVDKAAKINQRTILTRAQYNMLKNRVIDIYHSLERSSQTVI